MGLLETAMYIGIVIGSTICPYVFSKVTPKYVIISAVLLNAAAVSIFSITTSYWTIFASRVGVGMFLSVFIIFFPVWIDSCAPE